MREWINLLQESKKLHLDFDPSAGFLDAYLEDGWIHLSAIGSHRKGGGTTMMRKLCSFADEHDLPIELLALEAEPFYAKFGFSPIGDDRMRREPQ